MTPLKYLLLIPTSIVSVAVALKLAPTVADFAVPDLTSICSGLASWFRPPYLYLVINGIIAIIFACSKLQSTKDEQSRPKQHTGEADTQPPKVAVLAAGRSIPMEPNFNYSDMVDNQNACAASPETAIPVIESYEQLNESVWTKNETVPFHLNAGKGGFASADESSKERESVVPESPQKSDMSTEMAEYAYPNVKPLISARFGHRRNLKSSPEGGGKMVLGVSKPRRQDTLEATWKTISEGRAMPLNRHLKKFDTWERHGGPVAGRGRQSQPRVKTSQKTMTKSDTFSDVVKAGNASQGGRLKREPSLSQDELNRRVETFIRKFNEEMRLQRQESLNQHLEMANRGLK